jgi:metallo-beta-lactamase class B
VPNTNRIAGLLLAVLFGIEAQVCAQTLPPNLTKEDLAKDNNLFLSLARKVLKWDEPTEPIKIVGPLYFVGTMGLSSWLFTTPEGHILLNTGMPTSGPYDGGVDPQARLQAQSSSMVMLTRTTQARLPT